METIVFMLDTIALMVVIYFSLKTEKSPDKRELGPFRIRVDAPVAQPVAKRQPRQRVIRGL